MLDEIAVALFTELLGIGWLAANEAEAGNATALLIDRDEGLDLAEVAQIVDELSQLIRRLDISTEENKSSRLEFAEFSRRFRIEFRSRHAGEK